MFLYEILENILLSKVTWLLVTLFALFYHYSTRKYDYFEKRNVRCIPPLPFVGNMMASILRKSNLKDVFDDFYWAYPDEKLIGVFEFQNPIYIIRDPEIIKQITVKGFDHFMNHRGNIDETLDALFGRSLFAMRDQRWKDMRSTLSPAFTGSKMRNMFSLVADCSNDTIKFLLTEANGAPLQIEMKDLFTRFTNDVIATCSFGIQINSLKDRDNEFFEMGKVVTNFDGIQGLKFFGFSSFPKLMKFFKISLFNAKTREFFRELVHGTMTHREQNHIIRPDMINLLMQAKKGKLTHNDNEKMDDNVGFATVEESALGKASTEHIKKWDDDDLTAQCVIFFLAGFDTVSVLMCFMAHELAVNPSVQHQLYAEVKDVQEELNGKPLNYEILQKMKYMDMVVCETLRKWPPAMVTDRLCNKSFVVDEGNGKKVQMEPGDSFWMPVYSIHHDPQYYPNPEVFDPERFSDENKVSINQFTYFPFGLGPRNCIGSRFALMESKAIIFYMLSTFHIEKSPKTQDPIQLKRGSFNMLAEKGFWVKLRPRQL